jgi:hypothetical protein
MKKNRAQKKITKQSKKSLLTQADTKEVTDKVTTKSLSKEDMKSLIDSEIKFPKHLQLEEDIRSKMNNEKLTALINTLIDKIDSLYDDFEILANPSIAHISCEDSKEYARRMKKKILELPRGEVLILKLKRIGVRLLTFGDTIVT